MERLSVTDAELAVLERLWKMPESAVRDLAAALYDSDDAGSIASVQKLLERLEAKDCVARRKDGKSYLYRATADRSELIDHGLRGLADRLCNGALAPLVTHLVESKQLSKKERGELNALLAKLAGKAKRPTES